VKIQPQWGVTPGKQQHLQVIIVLSSNQQFVLGFKEPRVRISSWRVATLVKVLLGFRLSGSDSRVKQATTAFLHIVPSPVFIILVRNTT